MNATAHPFTPEEIMAFLDGELPVDRAQLVSSHTESCAACRATLDSLRCTSQSVSKWSVASLRADAKLDELLYSGAGAAAQKRTDASVWKLAIFPRQRSRFLVTSGVLAVLILMVVGLTQSQYRMSLPRAKQALEREAAVKRGSNQISSTSRSYRMSLPTVANDSNGPSHGNGAIAEDSVSVDDAEAKDQLSVSFAQPMIARTVSLSIVTKDFDASHKSLEAILARHNGYAASLSVSTPQGAAKSIEASLRVPAPQLAAMLSELRALGRVENEGQNGEEVTQEHADLVARLKNSRETELRLQDILVHRTGKVIDVLSVEREIDRVRGEIEQMEAEQKNLEHRVDFATIDLKLSEEYKAQLSSPAPSVSTLLRNALINGLRTAGDSILSLILFLSESGPVFLLWLLILALPAWKLWRRYRRAAAAI